ncbi:hypothetical protein L596_026414 [Steinernema carpocapsae]|uniref:Uncharacterized protein n=2 Tax=Steinernema carpocapsae TaxID=34508 RepID=A0A4U5M1C9_STECR|nr:hypothetical protein L596_026414 [Steinernema carpocapsae]
MFSFVFLLAFIVSISSPTMKMAILTHALCNRYDKGLACFGVWSGEQAFQGCWVNPMSSLRQCQKEKCKAKKHSKRGINFCCCFGNKCNADYSN